MSKFGDDLRRIVRYQELLDLINGENGTADQATKGAIDGARGIAYGGSGGSTTGTPGIDQPNNGGGKGPGGPVDTGTFEGEQGAVDGVLDYLDAIGEVGNTADLSDPDNTDRDGWYDLESLLNGEVDAAGKNPPAPGSNKAINALTGITDLLDTRALIVHLKEAANAFIAPSDRESSNQRVDVDGFESGLYYSLTTPPGEHSELQDVVATGLSYANSNGSDAPYTFTQYLDSGTASPVSPPFSEGDSIVLEFTGGTGFGYFIIFAVLSCVNSPPSSPYSCPIIAPAALWADLGATQLAFQTVVSSTVAPFSASKEGRFVPHPYDSNIPSDYADGVSIIDALTSSGSPVRIGPLHYGGWYAHYSTAGVPTGAATANSVLIINANKTHGGFVTPNQLLKLLPPST